jgi:hypothetical protein
MSTLFNWSWWLKRQFVFFFRQIFCAEAVLAERIGLFISISDSRLTACCFSICFNQVFYWKWLIGFVLFFGR